MSNTNQETQKHKHPLGKDKDQLTITVHKKIDYLLEEIAEANGYLKYEYFHNLMRSVLEEEITRLPEGNLKIFLMKEVETIEFLKGKKNPLGK